MAFDGIAPEWRECKGFPGYEVSNFGQVRKNGRLLATSRLPKYAYTMVQFTMPKGSPSKQKKVYVHRLVALAFLPPPAPGQCDVDHIDNDKANNRADNLQWLSRRENIARKQDFGTGNRKFTREQRAAMVRAVLRERRGVTEVAREFGASAGYVSRIALKETIQPGTFLAV